MVSKGKTELPAKLVAPARRALTGAGLTTLEDVAGASEDEILALHGMGPTAMEVLRAALKEHNLSFRG
jgi:hypothetical protein